MPKVAPVDYDTIVPSNGAHADQDPPAANHQKAGASPASAAKYSESPETTASGSPQKLDQAASDEIFRSQRANRAVALETSMVAVETACVMIPNYSGIPVLLRPMIMPKRWPLNLVFFRKIYSRLRLTHPKGEGVDVEVFNSRIERLFKAFGNKNTPAPSVLKGKDKDGSGWITWQECCECWREEDFTINLSLLERVYLMLDQQGCSSSIVAWIASTTIMSAIAVSSCMFLLSSMPAMKLPPCSGCEPKVHGWFADVEVVACILFTAEYVIRFLCAHSTRLELLNNDYLLDYVTKDVEMKLGTGMGRTIGFVLDASNVIDLLAILPCYITKILPPNTNLTVLRLIRLSRIFRVLKMGNIGKAKDVLTTTMEYSWPSLSMVLFIIVMWVLVFSVLVFLLEMGEWDEAAGIYIRNGEESASPFTSIPATFWWTIVTVTTVGYGDYAPIGDSGRAAGTITIIGGVIAFAMPVGIIASQFDKATEEYESIHKNVGSTEDGKYSTHETQEVVDVLQKFGGDGRAEIRFEVHERLEIVDSSEFLGFASVDFRKLKFPPEHSSSVQVTLPLQPDYQLANRKVSGNLTVSLLWQPDNSNGPADSIRPIKLKNKWIGTDILPEGSEPIPLLRGQFSVVVHQATGLTNISLHGNSKAFVRICLCPTRTGGIPSPEIWETEVCSGFGNILNPVWGTTKVFNIDWASCPREDDPARMKSANGGEPTDEVLDSSTRFSSAQMAALMMFPARRIVELQQEVIELRKTVADGPSPAAKRASLTHFFVYGAIQTPGQAETDNNPPSTTGDSSPTRSANDMLE